MSILAWDKLQLRKDEIFQNKTYSENCFQQTGYDLRVNDEEALVDGKYYVLGITKNTGLIEIPAGQIAFLSTIEELKMPIDLVGKIGLRFTYARKGLISLFGPQVDPLYNGKLYLAVYNLSEKPIYLKPGDRLFNLEFHTVLSDYLSIEEQLEKFPRQIKYFDSLPSDVISEWQGTRMVSNLPRLAQLEGEVQQLKLTLESQSATSQYIIVGGVLLITITILGGILQAMYGIAGFSTENTSQSLGLALAPYIVFLLAILIVVGFMYFFVRRMTTFNPTNLGQPSLTSSNRRERQVSIDKVSNGEL